MTRIRKALIETPFEVLVFVVFVVDGIYQLFHGVKASPSTVTAVLPYWLLVVWQATLVLGGSIGLVGRLRAAWQIERAGLAMVGPAAFVYGLAIIYETGLRGLVAASIDIMIGCAFLIRYWVLGNAAKKIIEINSAATQ